MSDVDVVFSLVGESISADHGYHLLSAISKHLPAIHGNKVIGIHSVSSMLSGNKSTWLRRTLKIKYKKSVGFVVEVNALMAEESILLQEKSFVGQRRFGHGKCIPRFLATFSGASELRHPDRCT